MKKAIVVTIILVAGGLIGVAIWRLTERTKVAEGSHTLTLTIAGYPSFDPPRSCYEGGPNSGRLMNLDGNVFAVRAATTFQLLAVSSSAEPFTTDSACGYVVVVHDVPDASFYFFYNEATGERWGPFSLRQVYQRGWALNLTA